MACAEKVEIEVTWREWCWTWHGPWRCKKSAIKTRYKYDFRPTRSNFAFFRKSYEGCCGAMLYKYSGGYALFGTGNGPWDQFNTITKYFDQPLNPIGNCPFN